MEYEEWKVIEGFDNYEVSSYGRIRNTQRSSPCLRLKVTDRGYLTVCLCKRNIHKHRRVHNLVMAAFVGPKPPEYQTNHKDGNKQNNRLTNLEYVTASANVLHAYDIGLRTRKNTLDASQSVRESNRIRYWECKLAGFCPRCTKDTPVLPNRSSCASCAEKINARMRVKRRNHSSQVINELG